MDANKHLKVFEKGDLPKRWHFSNHRRITPIVAVTEIGWSVTSSDYFDTHPKAFTGGAHGYDPREPDMKGIFIASGPSFKPGGRIGAIESVHVYELLCALMNIDPANNDGELEVWKAVLN